MVILTMLRPDHGRLWHGHPDHAFYPHERDARATLRLRPEKRELNSGEKTMFWDLAESKSKLNHIVTIFPAASPEALGGDFYFC